MRRFSFFITPDDRMNGIQRVVEANSRMEALEKLNAGIEVEVIKGSTSIPDVRPVQWPTVLLPLRLLAVSEDRGAGDIIARIVGPIGGDAFKKWYKTLFGKDCGCGHRQDVLNARWPL